MIRIFQKFFSYQNIKKNEGRNIWKTVLSHSWNQTWFFQFESYETSRVQFIISTNNKIRYKQCDISNFFHVRKLFWKNYERTQFQCLRLPIDSCKYIIKLREYEVKISRFYDCNTQISSISFYGCVIKCSYFGICVKYPR